MKIAGPGSLHAPVVRRGGRGGGSAKGTFAKEFDGELPAAGGTGGAASLPGIEGLLSLQEVDDPTSGPSRAKARAEELLDRLEELLHGLLAGVIPAEQLATLARLANSQRAAVSDPRLVAILDEIDLRAQVELAKLAPHG